MVDGEGRNPANYVRISAFVNDSKNTCWQCRRRCFTCFRYSHGDDTINSVQFKSNQVNEALIPLNSEGTSMDAICKYSLRHASQGRRMSLCDTFLIDDEA